MRDFLITLVSWTLFFVAGVLAFIIGGIIFSGCTIEPAECEQEVDSLYEEIEECESVTVIDSDELGLCMERLEDAVSRLCAAEKLLCQCQQGVDCVSLGGNGEWGLD